MVECWRITSDYTVFRKISEMSRSRTLQQLRSDVFTVWDAAVGGVSVDKLMQEYVSVSEAGSTLIIGGIEYPLDDFRRIVVVGAGKASGAMAQNLENILHTAIRKITLNGWVNVPADCALPLKYINLHPARPAGVNEPTEEAVKGTQEIIKLLRTLSDTDICINLLSGGGSALLTAPEDGITLADKLELTRFLSSAGASINELNAVRKKISTIKGGGMKALCRGKQLISLLLSDVIGDPLDVIASGPAVDNPVSAAEALKILRRFVADNKHLINPVREESLSRIEKLLKTKAENEPAINESALSGGNVKSSEVIYDSEGGFVQNIIIGSNAAAVAAAGDEGYELGYSPSMYVEPSVKKTAEETGIELAKIVIEFQNGIIQNTGSAFPQTDLLIHGGEPVVHLAPSEIRGKGGRNQQLVLAALDYLLKHYDELNPNAAVMFLSGGTDGEDGPTDAAGAWFDSELLEKLHRQHTETNEDIIEPFLKRNDAYNFFERYNTLIKTGITGTNVCDVRIAAVSLIKPEH